MNSIQKAAFELNLDELKKINLTKENIGGAILSACSAHDAEGKKQIAIIRYLKSKGADINEVDKNGVTPLHRAVRFRSPAAVKMLLKMGAEINAQDKKSNSTALHRAVTNTGAPMTKGKGEEVIEILKALIKKGADIRIKNKLGKKPTDYVKDTRILKLFSSSS